jgi:hypothetical protein
MRNQQGTVFESNVHFRISSADVSKERLEEALLATFLWR